MPTGESFNCEWNLTTCNYSQGFVQVTGSPRISYNSLKRRHLTSSSQMKSSPMIFWTKLWQITGGRRVVGFVYWRRFSLCPTPPATRTEAVLRTGRQKNKENTFQKLRTRSLQLLRRIWLTHGKYYLSFRSDQRKWLGKCWGILWSELLHVTSL